MSGTIGRHLRMVPDHYGLGPRGSCQIDKSDFVKIKTICSAKGTVKRMKTQAIDWQKIFAKRISDKGLVSKIYKKLLKFNNKETTQLKHRQNHSTVRQLYSNKDVKKKKGQKI